MTPEDEKAYRKKYAEILIRTPDPFTAALELFPGNTTWAAYIARYWPKSPDVIAEKEALKKSGVGAEDLPDKADLCRATWDRMNGPCSADEFAKLGKLYAELQSMIEKPSAATNITAQIIIPKVIEIPNHGTDSEWEAKAEKQQKDLLSVSRNKS